MIDRFPASIAIAILVIGLIAWRKGTAPFLRAHGIDSRFSYGSMMLNLYTDFFLAVSTSFRSDGFMPLGVWIHGAAVIGLPVYIWYIVNRATV